VAIEWRSPLAWLEHLVNHVFEALHFVKDPLLVRHSSCALTI